MTMPDASQNHGQHPLRSIRNYQIAVWGIAAPSLVAVAWWALRPLPSANRITAPEGNHASSTVGPSTPSPEEAVDQQIDPKDFAVKLWNPVVAPVEAATVARADTATSKPLNLQLIGIISDGRSPSPTLRAALYDVDEDRLLIVADGERVHDRTVRILPGGLVELGEGQNKQRLLLRPDKEVSS